MKRITKVMVIMLAVVWVTVLVSGAAAAIKPEEIKKIEEAMPTKTTVKPSKVYKLLVFNRCDGFRHSSIPYWDQALTTMAKKTKAFEVTVSDDMEMFKPENLNKFDVLVLNNTTHLKFNTEKTPEICKSLLDFVKGGKGIVGIHAATDNFYEFPEAQEMMGGKFTGHPWTAGGTWGMKIDEPKHPLMKAFAELGPNFKVNDEIYRTDPPLYSRSKQRVLMSLDLSDPKTKAAKGVKPSDADTGITWIKTVGKGRIFYCSLGHNNHLTWWPPLLQHYLDGIQFAAGDLKVDTKPVPTKEK